MRSRYHREALKASFSRALMRLNDESHATQIPIMNKKPLGAPGLTTIGARTLLGAPGIAPSAYN